MRKLWLFRLFGSGLGPRPEPSDLEANAEATPDTTTTLTVATEPVTIEEDDNDEPGLEVLYQPHNDADTAFEYVSTSGRPFLADSPDRNNAFDTMKSHIFDSNTSSVWSLFMD